jgi:trans-aconitate 2-methyltransferase
VIALDRSPAMARLARERLPPGRAFVVVADLAFPLPIAPASFDAVVSTAAFHWVADHGALFARLARALRPGGRLVAQCGGAGNIDSVRRILAGLADGWRGPWTHAPPAETEARLRAAGFTGVRCWLNDEATAFESREALAAFLRTVVLWPYLERLPDAERDGFVDLVVDRLGGWVLDNVRLNIVARRGPGR